MSKRTELIASLKATLNDLLNDAGLSAVTVTDNPFDVPSAARGAGCIIIQPPDLHFNDWQDPTIHWALLAVAGTTTNPKAAFEQIDTIIEALEAGHLNLASATPDGYQPPQGDALPAYLIKLNPLD